MKIGFLSRYDPKNINIWSGSLYHIFHKMMEQNQVEIIGNEILNQLSLFTRANFPSNTFIPVDRYSRSLGQLVSERIDLFEFDLLFLGDLFFNPTAINCPFVLLSDLTTRDQNQMHDAKIDERHIASCAKLEKLSLDSAFRIIYSSEWAKQQAVELYGIDAKKIHVVELGANIPTPTEYLVDVNMDFCRLVFISNDWVRKGGDKLLEIYKILKNEGFPCSLTIIGSNNKEIDLEDSNVTVYSFLDKSKPTDLEKIGKILSESHFLVLPTNFDAFGIVFCEASAFALPSITANVGGVGQAVIDGKNGFLLPSDATANDYAQKIKTVFSERDSYLHLRKSSRIEFESRLNWDVWGEKVNKIFKEAVNEWKTI